MTATRDLSRELAHGPDVEVVTPLHHSYDEARAVWNGCIDRRPAAIVRCRSARGVAHTVAVAVERELPLAIRGGGHSLPGFSTSQGGVVIDLSPMRRVEVDAAARVARAAGGCRWSDYDASTAAHGLASTGGIVSTTGVGGLTLGGGIGWLMNERGLACDNLLGAQLVTADGEIIETSQRYHKDLLWGLRGGGGNFGVVTRFDFRVSPIGSVTGGLVLYPMERAGEIVAAYRDMVGSLSDGFTTMLVLAPAPDEEFVPPELRLALCVGIVGCHSGNETDANAELERLRKLNPAVDLFDTMPYPAMQSLFDAEFPPGGRYYFKGGFLPAFPDGAADAVMEHMRARPSRYSEFDLHHMGGAIHRVGGMDTAFPDRTATYTYNIVARWEDPSDDDANRDWARSLAAALAPFGRAHVYVNFLSEPVHAGALEAAYGSERYQRLAALKRRYDPENVFRLNQNIPPAPKSSERRGAWSRPERPSTG